MHICVSTYPACYKFEGGTKPNLDEVQIYVLSANADFAAYFRAFRMVRSDEKSIFINVFRDTGSYDPAWEAQDSNAGWRVNTTPFGEISSPRS